MARLENKRNESILICDCEKFQHRLFVGDDGDLTVESKKISPSVPEPKEEEKKQSKKKKSWVEEYFEGTEEEKS